MLLDRGFHNTLHPPLSHTRGSQSLGIPSLLDKLSLKARDLPVKQVIGLVDKTDDSVRHYRWVLVFEPLRILGSIDRIGPIRRIRPIHNANGPDLPSVRVLFCPRHQSSLPQKVLIVQQEFVKACSSHVYEAEFRLA